MDCTLLSTWHIVGAQSFIAFLCGTLDTSLLSWTCVQGRGRSWTPHLVPIWILFQGHEHCRFVHLGLGRVLLPADSTITLLLGFYYESASSSLSS